MLRLAHPDNPNSQIQELEPLSISSFMVAFSKVGIFDFDLYEALENSFVKQIDLANGETLVTFFNSHAALSYHTIEECLVKKH